MGPDSTLARLTGPVLCTVCVVLAAVLVGCGVDPGKGTDGVQLTVTRDFGRTSLLETTRPKAESGDTVMGLLKRNAPVTTRDGGGVVQAIGNVAGGRRAGRPFGWSFYVNGSLTDDRATEVELHKGDRVWWDHHDRGVIARVPAVVGSFPEPFRRGLDGRRVPVRVECSDPGSAACDTVAGRLVEVGAVAGRSGLGESAADDTLRVLVGPWSRLRRSEVEADMIDRGPRSSGVFASFDRRADRLTVFDERGRAVRTLGRGAGLVAATEADDRSPVWFVTGTDEAGVRAAASTLDEATLADRYALAVIEDRPVSVPLVGGG